MNPTHCLHAFTVIDVHSRIVLIQFYHKPDINDILRSIIHSSKEELDYNPTIIGVYLSSFPGLICVPFVTCSSRMMMVLTVMTSASWIQKLMATINVEINSSQEYSLLICTFEKRNSSIIKTAIRDKHIVNAIQ